MITSICCSLNRSRNWLYKWIERYRLESPKRFQEKSRRPLNHPTHTSYEVEQAVKMVRLDLYNKSFFCGAQAISWELEDLGIRPLPSLSTINRILRRHDLTNRRAGRYEPKGKNYPALAGTSVNRVHQADFIGPCYLSGPIRFYSLNSIDLATGRCALEPLTERISQRTIDAFWAIWRRLGLPRHLQVDNVMVFYGSPTHPRGIGNLINSPLPALWN